MRKYPFYLVATPIGNIDDISRRALKVLGEVDLVLAEDTRVTGRLLSRCGITARLRPYHDHNKERVTPGIISEIESGTTAALVSDAGTPGISDPGFYMIRALIRGGIEFTAIPGPSSVTQALVLSGLPTDRFCFYGYMPRKKGARERAIREAGEARGTAVFFESPHRLVSTLEAISTLLPDRETVVARELTKLHEEVSRGTPGELLERYRAVKARGEITLLLAGSGRK